MSSKVEAVKVLDNGNMLFEVSGLTHDGTLVLPKLSNVNSPEQGAPKRLNHGGRYQGDKPCLSRPTGGARTKVILPLPCRAVHPEAIMDDAGLPGFWQGTVAEGSEAWVKVEFTFPNSTPVSVTPYRPEPTSPVSLGAPIVADAPTTINRQRAEVNSPVAGLSDFQLDLIGQLVLGGTPFAEALAQVSMPAGNTLPSEAVSAAKRTRKTRKAAKK